jgi:hypothetical protein
VSVKSKHRQVKGRGETKAEVRQRLKRHVMTTVSLPSMALVLSTSAAFLSPSLWRDSSSCLSFTVRSIAWAFACCCCTNTCSSLFLLTSTNSRSLSSDRTFKLAFSSSKLRLASPKKAQSQ